jgi:hypothetical protein
MPQGEFRMDFTQLAEKYQENNLRKEGHIKEGSKRPSERLEGPKKDMTSHHSTTNHNVRSNYTTGEGMKTRFCQQ